MSSDESGSNNGGFVDDGAIEIDADPIADLLIKASEDSSADTLEAFYEELINGRFFVPERQQEHQLTNQPDYPNGFLNILGIQNKDSVFVPMFSTEARVREWSGHDIQLRSLKLAELIDLLPAGWWLILNPGSEGEKDFSPWEIDLLKGGVANIPALVDELLVEDVIEDIELHAVEPEQHADLKSALIDAAKKTQEVVALYLLKETGKTVSAKEMSSLVLGILISQESADDREKIQEQFSSIGALVLIGAEKLKVRVGDSIAGNLMLGIFEGHEPIYMTAKPSLFGRFFKKK